MQVFLYLLQHMLQIVLVGSGRGPQVMKSITTVSLWKLQLVVTTSHAVNFLRFDSADCVHGTVTIRLLAESHASCRLTAIQFALVGFYRVLKLGK